jgi:integral membrane protein (TIGR01906 family)
MSTFRNRTLKTLTVLLIPIILILGAVRLLTTDGYLAFEYGKSSFPRDVYGFTPQQRFILASTNIHYVRAHLPDNELAKQTLNGAPVYTEREVSHMADVQAVFQSVLRVWQLAFILFIFLGIILWRDGERIVFTSAVQLGGLLTSGLILTIALLAIFAWQTWFELFHRFLFVPGTWLFSYTDTHIPLIPVEIWYDATLSISAIIFICG